MNGILCVNKPQNMTSFDVVAKVRKVFGSKVGHTGTLDPGATGVLVCAINKATKAINYIDVKNKTYVASMKLGQKTHTGDIWGDVLDEVSVPEITQEQVISVLETFVGPMSQRVPKVSAKKIDGKRSYDLVRQNQEVEQLYTDINILDIKFISMTADEISFEATVSNGTYIRTLCEDIAEKLGTIGTMSALERTVVGIYTLEDCVNLEDLSSETPLYDVKEAIVTPKIDCPELDMEIGHGKRIKLDTEYDEVMVNGGVHFAIYEREKDNQFKSVRGLW